MFRYLRKERIYKIMCRDQTFPCYLYSEKHYKVLRTKCSMANLKRSNEFNCLHKS